MAWTKSKIDITIISRIKIDIRKSIISRIERVTNCVPNLTDRTDHDCVQNLIDRTGHDCVRPSQNFSKLDERCHTSAAAPLGTARLDHASIEGRRRCSQTRGPLAPNGVVQSGQNPKVGVWVNVLFAIVCVLD